MPTQLPIANLQDNFKEIKISTQKNEAKIVDKTLIGFDLYIDWQKSFAELLELLKSMESEKFELKMISTKGLILFPLIDAKMMPSYSGDLTSLRFTGKGICGKNSQDIINYDIKISPRDILNLIEYLSEKQIDFVKFESLYLFDKKVAYTSGQGE